MKKLTREQQRYLVRVWDKAGPELERIKKEDLRGLPYNWRDVVTVLEMGDFFKGPPRLTSGLVEMQRLFKKAARQQGLLPAVAREEPALYTAGQESENSHMPKPDRGRNGGCRHLCSRVSRQQSRNGMP